MFSRVLSYFSVPIRLVALNATLLVLVVAANFYWQVFCIPSNWALVLISVCFVNTVFYPMLSSVKGIHALIGFLNGVSFCLFLYCAVFLAQMNFYGLFMIPLGIGLLIYVPHFLAIQLIRKSVLKPISKFIKRSFIFGMIVCASGTLFIAYQYKQAISEIRAAERLNYEGLEPSFWNEKILGMHFIYHTAFCEFDGWRPPIHEPILVLGMWLNGGVDPIDIDLEERVALYKKLFPEKPIKYSCSCATSYAEVYHGDSLLQ